MSVSDEARYPEHDDGKWNEILMVAAFVFGQYGLRKTTMEDIRREAHVARSTLYRYFSNKDEIFRAVVEREAEDMLEAVRLSVAEQETTRGKLRAAIMTYADMIRHKVNVHRITQRALMDFTPAWTEHVQKMMRQLQDEFQKILAEGVAGGEIAVEAPDLAALTLVYALKGVFMNVAMDMRLASRDEIVDCLLDLMMDGMRPRRESV
ncbi:MAG: hypothetical protein DRJ15_14160 [Bacteroidetes bacterium]|nr:MAG: hypothetical protein DRJ15_14160 [Bacteroidota bacterium]